MMLRQHWGKAGTGLMGAAVVAGLAELSAVTTTDRHHVPLWPLAIIVLVFVFGCLLFAGRIRGQNPSDERVYAGREFADKEPEEIMKVFRRNTEIQSHKLLEPYQGKWLRATGPLENVGMWDNFTKHSQVRLKNHGITSTPITFWFSDKNVVHNRLALLDRGTRVTIIGKIDEIGALGISLDECVLEKVFGKTESTSSRS